MYHERSLLSLDSTFDVFVSCAPGYGTFDDLDVTMCKAGSAEEYTINGKCTSLITDDDVTAAKTACLDERRRLRALADAGLAPVTSVTLTVPLDVDLASLSSDELTAVKDKLLVAAATAGGFNAADVETIELVQNGKVVGSARHQRETNGAITVRIIFKDDATVNIDAAVASINTAIAAGTVSVTVTIGGQEMTVAVKDLAVATEAEADLGSEEVKKGTKLSDIDAAAALAAAQAAAAAAGCGVTWSETSAAVCEALNAAVAAAQSLVDSTAVAVDASAIVATASFATVAAVAAAMLF